MHFNNKWRAKTDRRQRAAPAAGRTDRPDAIIITNDLSEKIRIHPSAASQQSVREDVYASETTGRLRVYAYRARGVTPLGQAVRVEGVVALVGFFLHFLVKSTKKGAISAFSY